MHGLSIQFNFTFQQSIQMQPHSSSQSSPLDLYAMTKPALVKRIHTLTHELQVQIKTNAHRRRNYEEASMEQRIAEQEVVIETMSQNGRRIEEIVAEQKKEIDRMRHHAQQQERDMENYKKQAQTYKRKCEQMDKALAGSEKQQVRRQTEEQRQQRTKMQQQITRLSRRVKELTARVAILTDLNQQTQLQLASALSQHMTQGRNRSEEEAKENRGEELNRVETVSKEGEGKHKMEAMALKAKIKELQEELRQSEESKIAFKQSFQQKEHFYSKMLSQHS